jgi:hypothetical protein
MKKLIDVITFAGVEFKHYEVEWSGDIVEEAFTVFTFKKGTKDCPHYKSYAYIPDKAFDNGFDVAWGLGDTKEDSCYEALDILMS